MSYDLPWPSIHRAIELHDVETVLELARNTPEAVADWETCSEIFHFLAWQTQRWGEVYDLITLYVDEIGKNNCAGPMAEKLLAELNIRALADLAELFPHVLEHTVDCDGDGYTDSPYKGVKFPILALLQQRLERSGKTDEPYNSPAELERLVRANPKALNLKTSNGCDLFIDTMRYAPRIHSYTLAMVRAYPEAILSDPNGGINKRFDAVLTHFSGKKLLELLDTVPEIWQIPGVKARLMKRMRISGPLTFPGRYFALRNTPATEALPAPEGVKATPTRPFKPQSPEVSLATETGRWLVKETKGFEGEAFRQASKLRQQLLVLGQLLETASETHTARNDAEKLMREDLPKLVETFAQIPTELRQDNHCGSTPAEMMEAGLRRISLRVQTLSDQLKQESFDALAVHVRYLDYQTGHEDESTLKADK